MRPFAIPLAGDGLIMAEEAGAAIATSIPIIGPGAKPDDPQFRRFGGLLDITFMPETVWVNKRGERFKDESARLRHTDGSPSALQPGK